MDLNELIKNPEQIKNLIQVLEALLPKTETKAEPVMEEPAVEPKTYTQNNTIKTRGSKPRADNSGTVNKFERMAEFSMHKEDAALDKVLCKQPPVARLRDEVPPIEVTCRICGKKETVSPSLVFESVSRYKCNNCSTQAG
jgi:hypothetical protein